MVDYIQTLAPFPVTNPKAAEASRAYAETLLGLSKGADMNKPIGHWTQGVANMVKALVGGNELYQQQEKERQQMSADAAAMRLKTGTNIAPEVTAPTGFTSDEEGGAPTVEPRMAPGANNLPFDSGPMPTDFPGGVVPQPRPRPDAAPQTFNGRFNAATFSPAGGPDPTAPNYTFANNAIPSTSALPFDAVPQQPSNPLEAITRALSKGATPGGNIPFGAQDPAIPRDASALRATSQTSGMPTAPLPGAAHLNIPPGTVPLRPQVSDAQLQQVLSSPYVPQETKMAMWQMYLQRKQPVTMAVPGGNATIGADGSVYYIPALQANVRKVGPLERTQYSTITPGPNGALQQNIIPTNNAADQQEQQPAPTNPVGGPSMPTLKRVPAATPEAPLQFGPSEGGIDKSGLPPEILTGRSRPSAGEEGPPPGMLGLAPPGMEQTASAKPPAGPQIAGIDPEDQRNLQWLKNLDVQTAIRQHAGEKDYDAMNKTYTDLQQAGSVAARTIPLLELARGLVNDDRFYSGPMGPLVKDIKSVMSLVGNDPNKAAPMEVFEKIISGNIIQDLKTQLQGLGQIRLAEIDLMAKSAASLNRTKPANRAVLELMIRTNGLINDLSKVANDYKSGYRFDKQGNAIMTNEIATQSGLDAVLKRYVEANPILSPEERKSYEFLFKDYDHKRYNEVKKYLESSPQEGPQQTPVGAPQIIPPLPGAK